MNSCPHSTFVVDEQLLWYDVRIRGHNPKRRYSKFHDRNCLNTHTCGRKHVMCSCPSNVYATFVFDVNMVFMLVPATNTWIAHSELYMGVVVCQVLETRHHVQVKRTRDRSMTTATVNMFAVASPKTLFHEHKFRDVMLPDATRILQSVPTFLEFRH